jgi:signal transduction histidine kinase
MPSFLFSIAIFIFAAAAVILFFYQRQKNLKSLEDLQAKLSQESSKLDEAESIATNKVIEVALGAISMMSLKETAKIQALLAEQTRKVTQAEKAVVALFDRKSGAVRIDPGTVVVKGRKDQHMESWWKDQLNEMTKLVLDRESQPESGESPEESELLADCVLRKSSENSSLLCVPLKANNRYIGILAALNTYPYFFTDDEINLLSVLAQQAAAVLTELERSKGHAEVTDSEFEKELERVTTQCLQSQEAERKRISRELHDNTAQSLTHLVIRLQKINILISSEQIDLKNSMSKLIEIAEHTLEDVHEMAFQMRPAILEDLGLVETIRWYISHYLGTATLSVNFATKEKEVRLPPHVEIAVLRIIQEALTNIRKYAQASEAFVSLDLAGDEFVVAIKDNGIGFDVEETLAKSAEKKALGIKGMKERAELLGGSLEIISQPGQGTRITANIPLRFRLKRWKKKKKKINYY